MSRRIAALVLIVGVGIGALAFVALAPDDAPIADLPQQSTTSLVERLKRSESSELTPEQVALIVDSLVQVLDEEIRERRVLQQQLEEMQTAIAELQRVFQIGTTATANAAARAQSADRVAGTINERLQAAGFTPEQIDSVRRREAEAVMQRIELDDQARREGWVNTPRYWAELAELTDGAATIRRELGDDAYDRYLFASGRPNRLSVTSVIETSPAESAGFQVGDIINSYGNERVFSTAQLNELRSSGERGVAVTVEVIRDGRLLQLSIPRGPMGLNAHPHVFDPSSLGGG